MPLPAKIASLFRSLFYKARLDRELDAELRAYLDLLTEEKIKTGMSPDQARRQARLELGGMEQVKMKVREVRFGTTLETVWQDVRYGLRMLRKNPGFTTVAVLTLALGIGANTAIFSVVHAAMLRSLPVVVPDRLVSDFTANPRSGSPYGSTSYLDFETYREGNESLSELVVFMQVEASLGGVGPAERLRGLLTSAAYFSVLGVQPHLGRMFVTEEGQIPGSRRVVVLGYDLWKQKFGADRNIINKAIRLNGWSYTVVGVSRAGFRGTQLDYIPNLWVPVAMLADFRPGFQEAFSRPHWSVFSMIGRLRPDVTVEQATANLNVIAQQISQNDSSGGERKISLLPVGEATLSPRQRGAFLRYSGILLAVVGVILVVACINVSNLLLARAVSRRRELALRLALGADWWRLVRQLITESLLLSVLGGMGGLLLATWSFGFLEKFQPAPRTQLSLELGLNGWVLAFTFGLVVASGLLAGVLPALQAARLDLIPALKDGSGGGGRVHSFPIRPLLVVAQVGLCLVLLIGAGLLVRTLQNLRAVDLGFQPEDVLVFSLDPGQQGYTEEQGKHFFEQLMEGVQALPGIQSVSLTRTLPVDPNGSKLGTFIEGRVPEPDERLFIDINLIQPGYFRTLQIPLIEGRDFSDVDAKGTAKVAIVNRTLARQYWPNESPLGKGVGFSGPSGPFYQIVGVVQDVKIGGLREESKPHIYLSHRQIYEFFGASMRLVVRSSLPTATVVGSVRQEAQKLDSEFPVYDIKTLPHHLAAALAQEKQATTFLSLFSLLGLVLTLVGLYGVLNHFVGERTREIGIRMALGAQRGDILKMVVGQGMLLVIVGVGIGLAGALVLTRFLESLLFGVTPTDPATFAAVAAVLAAVALLACYLPARRATKVDPMVALRYE